MRKKVVIAVVLAGGLIAAALLWPGREASLETPLASHGEVETAIEEAPEQELSRVNTTEDAPAEKAGTAITAEALAELNEAIAAGDELQSMELATLYALIKEVRPDDDEQNGHVRKNNLMNTLNRQPTLPSNVVDIYASLYRDSAQNGVIRDYAIQHVYETYERLPGEKQKADAVKLLQEAAAQSDSSIAGTAILALARLIETEPNLPKSAIAATAFELARNPSANPSARISALQVIGRLDSHQALPVLRDAAQQAESVLERASAIGALGVMGGKSEEAILRTIAEGDNPRLQPIALTALQRIRERAGGF